MSRITRLAVSVTALASLLAVLSSTAGAVTWHNTGSTSFTATSGATKFSVGTNNLICSSSTTTGTAPAATAGVGYVMTGTERLSGCSLAGQSTYVHCRKTFTAGLYTSDMALGSVDLTCVAWLTAVPISLCHIAGSRSFTYYNPTGTTPGRFIESTTTSLTVSNATSSCPLGTGAGSAIEETSTVSSGTPTTTGPDLERTA